MVNKQYAKGYRFELRTKKYLEAKGFYVCRAAGSHGAFDLIAIPKSGKEKISLIQCKCRPPIKKEYDDLTIARDSFENKERFFFVMAYSENRKLKFELCKGEFVELTM